MTTTNMDLSELLAKHDQGDFLRSIAEAVLQLIMEVDVECRGPDRRGPARAQRRAHDLTQRVSRARS